MDMSPPSGSPARGPVLPTRCYIRRWMGLGVALMVSITTGFDLAFTVYSVRMKDQLNLTQTQVETVSTAGMAGFLTIPLTPILDELGGLHLTLGITLLTGTGCLMLLYSVAQYSKQVANLPLLQSLLHFGTIASMSIVSLQIASTTLSNWPLHDSGKIRGSIFATNAIAKAFFVVLFERGVGESLDDFFLATAALYFVIIVLCSAVLRPVPLNSNDGFVIVSVQDANNIGDAEVEVKKATSHKDRCLRLITNPLIHVIAWPGALFQACCLTLVNDVSTLNMSLGVTVPDEVAIVTLSVSNILVRLVSGVFVDSVVSGRSHQRQVGSQIFITTLLAISVTVYLVLFKSNVAMYVVMVTIGASLGAGVIFPISTLVHLYGKPFYMAMVCFYNIILIAGVCFLQTMIGIIFDNINLCESLTRATKGEASAKVCLLLVLPFSVLTTIPHFISFLFVRKDCKIKLDNDSDDDI